MRTPSVKTLSQVFENPKEAKRVLQMTRDELLAHPEGAKLAKSCFNPPSNATLRLTILDSLESGLHGIEYIHGPDCLATYLNAGDTYAATLILFQKTYRVQCLGDFVETQARRGFKFN